MLATFLFLVLPFLHDKAVCAIDRTPRVTACINEIKPNNEEIASFKRKEIPKTDKGKCLLACYLEAKGLIQGGKFSSSGAEKVAGRAYPNNLVKTGHVRHILSHCGAVVSKENNKCELATRLAHCTTTMAEKFRL